MISVVIPTYEMRGHGASMLSNLLSSLKAREGAIPYEICISDNCEDDTIFKVYNQYKDSFKEISYSKSSKKGVAANTNNAVSMAKYDIIKPMYQDDVIWRKGALDLFYAAAKKGWCFSYSKLIDASGRAYKTKEAYFTGVLSTYNSIGMPSCVAFKKSDLIFDEGLQTLIDVAYYNDLFKEFGHPKAIPEFLIGQRYWPGQQSQNQNDFSDEELEKIRGAMNRYDLINSIIEHFRYKTYLEIGVDRGKNFERVVCDYKVGVDPDINSRSTLKMTSDDFFAQNTREFDCIFIDGLHHADQVYKDIQNARLCLSKGGTIICHDMKPKSYGQQAVPRIQDSWTGDCWKAWIRLRQESETLHMFVADVCTGCGVIREGRQKKLNIKGEVNYDNLVLNMDEWLNVIPTDQFRIWLRNGFALDKLPVKILSSQD